MAETNIIKLADNGIRFVRLEGTVEVGSNYNETHRRILGRMVGIKYGNLEIVDLEDVADKLNIEYKNDVDMGFLSTDIKARRIIVGQSSTSFNIPVTDENRKKTVERLSEKYPDVQFFFR